LLGAVVSWASPAAAARCPHYRCKSDESTTKVDLLTIRQDYAKVAAESQEARNITPASSTDHKRKGAYALFKKRFKVALGCMAIRTQTGLMIHRAQFIRRTKEAATQAACAGNTRGYHSKYGNSWFNNRENDDAYYMFRSYNNCFYSSSEPVTDEEDELYLQSNLYLVQE